MTLGMTSLGRRPEDMERAAKEPRTRNCSTHWITPSCSACGQSYGYSGISERQEIPVFGWTSLQRPRDAWPPSFRD
jgi:hypothetical protein